MTLYGILINILHANWIYNQMTTILKRRPSIEQSNLGIWKGIIKFITMSSIMFNVGIILLSSKSFEELLEKMAGEQFSEKLKYIVLIIIEHLVYFLMLILLRIVKK